MKTIINLDFELNTFYWQYVNAEHGVITYTVECFDTSKGHMKATFMPFMTIKAHVGHEDLYEAKVHNDTIDTRVIDALKRHFTHREMLEDGHMMLAEYVNGASGELHKSEHGQAIFGCDLEEAHESL